MNKSILGSVAMAAALSAGVLLAPSSFAEGIDCSAVDNKDKLDSCLFVGQDVTLSGNIEIPAFNALIEAGKSIKLDLAGHNITVGNDLFPALWIKEGHLEITGSGTITASASNFPAILISGSTEQGATNYSSLTIGKDVKLVNNNYAAISVDEYSTTGAFYGVNIDFSGTATGKYGIQVSKNATSYNGNLPIINIHDGAKINAKTNIETDAPGQAIRAEGRATWNINKATITGDTGIALRAGKFHLNGATITATGPDEAVRHHFATDKSGDTYCDPVICEKLPGSGAAIQIQEAKTEDESGLNDIEIFINGGTYESKHGYAISEYKERVENPHPAILTDTIKTFTITEGSLKSFSDISPAQVEILKNETRYNLYMVTDDFSWRFDGGRMCADGSAAIKSYDEDWLRTNFIIRKFGKIQGLADIYQGLPWIERLLVDYTSFPGPYTQYDFSDGENVALDIYAESKGKKYEDIPILKIADIDLYRFEKDGIDLEIESEQGYFRGSLTTPGDYELEGSTGKPYTIIHDTEIYPLTFTMKLPEDVPIIPSGYTRKYLVLDFHCTSDGTAAGEEVCEVIELPTTMSEDETEYTFSTTKFSAFVLTYEDEEIEEEEESEIIVPNTGFMLKAY